MKKQLFALLVGSVSGTAAMAQFQVNPQAGLPSQNLTTPPPTVKYKAVAGWQLGADLRFGDRLYLQPGAFFGRNTTVVSTTGDTITFEDNLVRQT